MAPPGTIETVVIPGRFNGPPESANGGYACGLFAGLLDQSPGPSAGPTARDAETTLRSPPPLDHPLSVERDDEGVSVLDGDTLVARVEPTVVDVDVPEPPSLEDARAATAGWPGVDEHVFPGCFTCGPAREPDDGMRVFPGPTADGRYCASPWIPHRSLADAGELVPEPVMWAALDCPGMAAGVILDETPALLGRMAARVERRAEIGTEYVVYAWSIGSEGRKHYSASAVVDPDGSRLAVARLTTIALP